MKNTNTNTNNITETRRSFKGKWGKVGAPPKSFIIPKGKFTMKEIFAANADSCELTIRTKVNAMLESGKLAPGKPVPQPNNSVGRPQTTFRRVYGKQAVVKKTRKARKARTVAVAATVEVPTTPPVVTVEAVNNVPVVSVAVIAVPTEPVVTVPVEMVAAVEVPASPAPVMSELVLA
jgi:hypothetical protein